MGSFGTTLAATAQISNLQLSVIIIVPIKMAIWIHLGGMHHFPTNPYLIISRFQPQDGLWSGSKKESGGLCLSFYMSHIIFSLPCIMLASQQDHLSLWLGLVWRGQGHRCRERFPQTEVHLGPGTITVYLINQPESELNEPAQLAHPARIHCMSCARAEPMWTRQPRSLRTFSHLASWSQDSSWRMYHTLNEVSNSINEGKSRFFFFF